jgi:hypothetical protein
LCSSPSAWSSWSILSLISLSSWAFDISNILLRLLDIYPLDLLCSRLFHTSILPPSLLIHEPHVCLILLVEILALWLSLWYVRVSWWLSILFITTLFIILIIKFRAIISSWWVDNWNILLVASDSNHFYRSWRNNVTFLIVIAIVIIWHPFKFWLKYLI